MAEQAALRVVVSGRVQGVMFRDFTRHVAARLGLTGYVHNLPGGRAVEVVAEGEREELEKLLEAVKRGPPHATVEKTEQEWSAYTGRYANFRITF